MVARLLKNRATKILWSFELVSLIFLLASGYILKPAGISAELSSRSILIDSSQPSVITNHFFNFNVATAGTIGSIKFEYCDNTPLFGFACNAPAGLSVAAAVISNQSGISGFSIDPATNTNTLVISRAPSNANAGPVSFTFGNITNPSTVNQSVYVRISTYAATGATGPHTDNGSVVFVLSRGLGAAAFVPPWLVLCVGAVVALDCSNQSNNIQDLGTLTFRTTGSTTTQFSVGTNDPGGYNVYVNGPTLTSGNNIIAPLLSAQPSQHGNQQFGLNLVANGSPPVGTNPGGIGTGVIAPGYNTPNLFKFNSGDLVASSNSSTDFNLYTVSYIANINSSQQPGLYSTTMTYIGTASF